jgi:hypothetical protein
VRENAAGGESDPEFHAPPSDVLVCGMAVGSQLTHATLPPDFTCTVGVANLKSRMKMTAAPAAVVGTVQLAALTVEFDVERSEKHAAMPSETTTSVTATAGAERRKEKRVVI